MEKLKLKATAEASVILIGFFVFGILVSFLFDEATGELFRVVLLEWGAFPMLCAICGGVVSMEFTSESEWDYFTSCTGKSPESIMNIP